MIRTPNAQVFNELLKRQIGVELMQLNGLAA